MQLKHHLKKTGQSENEFAKRYKIPQSVVNRITQGFDATGRNWARIHHATRGRVRVTDHYDPNGNRLK